MSTVLSQEANYLTAESSRLCRTLHTLWLHCPTKGKLRGNKPHSLALKEFHKIAKCPGLLVKFRAEGTSECRRALKNGFLTQAVSVCSWPS